jgi:desampylase
MWGMILMISRQHRQQLVDWAAEAHPEECCGLLLGEGDKVRTVVLARNVSATPLRAFEIDPAVLIQAEKSARMGGDFVIGHFHSHPNGVCEPSFNDADQAHRDQRFWMIVAEQKVSVWQTTDDGSLFACFDRVDLRITD